MPADPNIIETTEADAPYEPSVTPPKLTRADVLTQVRILATQVNAFGVLVEQAARNARMRTEFVDAWRRWAGSFVGWHIALERTPFHPEVAVPMLRQREGMLKTWRQGLDTEMGQAQQAGVGVAQPAPASEPVPEKKGILSTIPYWVLIPAGIGVAVGGYYGMRWVFRQWFGAADEHVQTVRYISETVSPNPQPAPAAQPQEQQAPPPPPPPRTM
jgi:hypothetical protein